MEIIKNLMIIVTLGTVTGVLEKKMTRLLPKLTENMTMEDEVLYFLTAVLWILAYFGLALFNRIVMLPLWPVRRLLSGKQKYRIRRIRFKKGTN